MNDEPLARAEREMKGRPGVNTGDTGRLRSSYGREDQ